ncbi:peptide-methionine (S)-S-oxide reductase [Moritella sp. Urea-trap-13]|uniref:peptide-methionine (S)-S-oxide reductase n=1 Tax=Moritella sp. Urea-trap-13 TaxID=2058327 RepID=UPI000C3344E1|nr:peptide-methionine (S)-S-oxide reductase [Moritella sp. Urea-trap-13]PKH04812.1 peptide methionine sulfoxide reductase [Moritella sp. Urea-trap-13]
MASNTDSKTAQKINHKGKKIGLSGSCYWCTEAIFLSLRGVTKVEQGWLSSFADDDWFSEGIIISYIPDVISLKNIIAIHLHTHSSTKAHSMRNKYRSAVYAMEPYQITEIKHNLALLQDEFEQPLITRAYTLNQFKLSDESMQNYYYSDPQRPFCENIITPKLKKLLGSHANLINKSKLPAKLMADIDNALITT